MRFAGRQGILWTRQLVARVKKNLFSIIKRNLIPIPWLKGFWFVTIMPEWVRNNFQKKLSKSNLITILIRVIGF